MTNFFDSLTARYGARPIPYGSNGPPQLPTGNTANPVDQFSAPATTPAPSPTANPFDQFDAPAPAQQAAPQQLVDAAPPVVTALPGAHSQQQPHPQGDQSTTVADQHVGGFADQHAPQPHAKLSPEDEAHYAELLHTGSAEQISAFLSDKNFHTDSAWLAKFIYARDFRRQHGGKVNYGVSYALPSADELHAANLNTGGAAGAFDRGFLETASLGTVGKASTLGRAVSDQLNGSKNSFSDDWNHEADIRSAVIQADQAEHPWLRLGGSVVGGAILPTGIEGLALRVEADALAAGRTATEARSLGQAAVRNRLAQVNGGYGAAHGAISADSPGDAVTGALSEGTLGAATGAVLGHITGAPKAQAVPSNGREILNAADRLNAGAAPEDAIQPLVANTSNGGMGSLLHGLIEPTVLGGKVSGLGTATDKFVQTTGKAMNRIADDAAGGSAENLTAVAARANDPAVPGSLAAYRSEVRQLNTQAYNSAEQLAGDTALQTPRTINAIDAKLAEWRQIPGGVEGMSKLEDLRETLANGKWTVQGLRGLRTSFGDRLDSSNRTVRDAASALWPTLSQDISAGLKQSGKGAAAKAYRAADIDYADRLSNLDVIDKVIGQNADLSADRVATNLKNMAANDYDKLGKALSAIDPVHANQIRGALVSKLGEGLASRNTPGETFSMESFATNWNKLSAEAKAATFAPATVRDLNDLALLTGSARRAGRLGNPSRSGVTNQNWTQVQNIGAATYAGFAGLAHPGTILALATPVAAGRLLATPGFARLLVRAGEGASPKILGRRLAELVRRNPAISQDIGPIKDAIMGTHEPVQQQDAAPAPEAPAMPDSTANAANPFDQFDTVQ
jgi:hypothetical protein